MLNITNNKKGIQKFKATVNSRYIYQKDLHKACFQHDIADRDFKYLHRRPASDDILDTKAFSFANVRCISNGYDVYRWI